VGEVVARHAAYCSILSVKPPATLGILSRHSRHTVRPASPWPRASKPQATFAWVSRRSSLILRIARATPGLRGSERILLIAEPAHEAAQFHANEWLRTQARDDRPNIQLMHLGELPRRELGVRVVPGAVVTGAQDNGGLGRTVVVGLFTPCPG